MNLKFTQKSKDKLKAIYQYHKQKSHGLKGRQIRAAIIKKAFLLKDFPLLGQEEEILKPLAQGHRHLVEGHYKIVYRVEGNEVLVINIFDTRQDPDKMLE